MCFLLIMHHVCVPRPAVSHSAVYFAGTAGGNISDRFGAISTTTRTSRVQCKVPGCVSTFSKAYVLLSPLLLLVFLLHGSFFWGGGGVITDQQQLRLTRRVLVLLTSSFFLFCHSECYS